MDRYDVFSFHIEPMSDAASDVLCALLGELGFDSFEQKETGVDAYVLADTADERAVGQLTDAFVLPDVHIRYERSQLESKDWNELWEREGFEPIVVPGLCVIHDTRHKVGTDGVAYDIRINPRMAFGSGTHETTAQLVERLLRRDLSGLRCLDMGCGTGILAICMALRGAGEVVGIDIDAFSVENTRENCLLNDVGQVQVLHGDASAIEGRFDCIVANIHRNIIAADLPTYTDHLAPCGSLLVSGFFETDIPAIQHVAEGQGLHIVHRQSRNDWAVVEFQS